MLLFFNFGLVNNILNTITPIQIATCKRKINAALLQTIVLFLNCKTTKIIEPKEKATDPKKSDRPVNSVLL